MSNDPRPYLDQLGVPWLNVTDPGYGYDGPFTPQCVFLHHTASPAGTNTCADVLTGRCYHACVGRDGIAYLGGHDRRQGHGGWGRTAPMNLARNGRMSIEAIRAWQNDSSADDTSTMPNEYGLAVCVDNNGTGEAPSDAQYTAFVATAAAFLTALGLTGDHLIDHASSTNRKVDLIGTTLELDPVCWYADIGRLVARLSTPLETLDMPMYRYLRDEQAGHLMLSDKMKVRWLQTEWDNEDAVAWLERLGLETQPVDVSRESIRLGEFGQWDGPLPPW